MTVEQAAAFLAASGIATPRVDAEWIVAHVAGVGRSDLATLDGEVDEDAVRSLAERRAAREPLAYVLGEWGFRRLTLHCDRRALVPRPETEVVVERCLELLRETRAGEALRVLDVGTGTGAIALALADELPQARVVGVDSSSDALALAEENVAATGLDVELVAGDVDGALPPGPFDLVVSNPPYVDAAEIELLEPEVRDWEPREALIDRGQTEALARAARAILRPGAPLVLEMHERHGRDVSRLLRELGYHGVRISRDLADRDRVAEGRAA